MQISVIHHRGNIPVNNGKRIICFQILDNYEYIQPELVKLLQTEAGKFLM
jgi:predicted protein tyrosine phosphatase